MQHVVSHVQGIGEHFIFVTTLAPSQLSLLVQQHVVDSLSAHFCAECVSFDIPHTPQSHPGNHM